MLHLLILLNITENSAQEYPLSDSGLNWALDTFPNIELFSLQLIGPTTLPDLKNIRELFLQDVHIDLKSIERVVQSGISLEVKFIFPFFPFLALCKKSLIPLQ